MDILIFGKQIELPNCHMVIIIVITLFMYIFLLIYYYFGSLDAIGK